MNAPLWPGTASCTWPNTVLPREPGMYVVRCEHLLAGANSMPQPIGLIECPMSFGHWTPNKTLLANSTHVRHLRCQVHEYYTLYRYTYGVVV